MADLKEEVYESGEIILAYHGPLLYEAKILATETRLDQTGEQIPLHLTHYKGWNRSWDEWLTLERIKKHNATNLEMQKLLKERMGKKKKLKTQTPSSNGRGTPVRAAKDVTAEPSTKKRRGDKDDEEAPGAFQISEPKVIIPNDLKLALVEDWNLVTRQSQLVKLPRDKTINQVLNSYCKFIGPQGEKASSVAREVTSGIKLFFRSACGSVLLYKQERAQYDKLVQDDEDIDICEHYGLEHLLRLFVKLPAMIQHSGVGTRGMVYLVKCFQDILQFIKTQNSPVIDAATYIPS